MRSSDLSSDVCSSDLMLALLMFGAPLEYTWGNRLFLAYYMVCVGGAGLCQLVVTTWMASQGAPVGPTLGASGGVFGLLLAYGMLFPNQRVMLLIPPIPMTARKLVIIYGAIEQIGRAHTSELQSLMRTSYAAFCLKKKNTAKIRTT